MLTKQNVGSRRAAPVGGLTIALAIAVGLGGTIAEAGNVKSAPAAAPESMWLAEATAPAASTGDEVLDILIAIGKIDARMQAGMVLYQSKDRKAAIQHFRFAREKVYKPMAPQLTAHELPAFDEGIRALEMASSPGQVAGAYLAVAKGLTTARGGLGATPRQQMTAIEMQTAMAAEALGKGLKDGQVKNAEQYQDAWGMILAARTAVGVLEGSGDPAVQPAALKIAAVLDDLIITMPEAVPEGAVEASQETALVALDAIKAVVATIE